MKAGTITMRVNPELKREAKFLLSASDPFYLKTNMEHLKRGVEALNAGKGREHELIVD